MDRGGVDKGEPAREVSMLPMLDKSGMLSE